ncbi:MAG: gfo/Idh/MocA family oxidoreductase, partial [Planctomycetota bacterium]
AVREYDSNQPGSQEVRLFQKFSDLVNKGELDPTWPEWTLKTQKVLDACFESSKQDGAVVHIS